MKNLINKSDRLPVVLFFDQDVPHRRWSAPRVAALTVEECAKLITIDTTHVIYRQMVEHFNILQSDIVVIVVDDNMINGDLSTALKRGHEAFFHGKYVLFLIGNEDTIVTLARHFGEHLGKFVALAPPYDRMYMGEALKDMIERCGGSKGVELSN